MVKCTLSVAFYKVIHGLTVKPSGIRHFWIHYASFFLWRAQLPVFQTTLVTISLAAEVLTY